MFPPWTVTRSGWAAALGANVPGIATDVMLFSQHGARLVHRYRVFADNQLHQSLRGSFMTKLSGFTQQATRGRDSSAESTPSPTPLRPAHRTLDHAPPAQKAARASATVTSTAEASADAPALTLGPLRLRIPDSCVPM